MIEIKNLTKIFKSKKHETVKALDDVSFTLPDSGFVFIVGKSGSGKTTLLNMIAAVDSYNSGSIVLDGINLNRLKNKELDYYRNQNIGFIFQDYQLLDELTVFENVKLALEFLNINNDSLVIDALKKVGLEKLQSRYPVELSGGEKQRVAIARAIVKNPLVILADEPTGNLDSITSKEILNILNEISKDKLVLIVTHNIFDAHLFASYILELSYGKLIGSYKRNRVANKAIEYKDNILRLPLHVNLDEDSKKEVLNKLDHNIKDIIQDDLDFIQCDLIDDIEYKNKKLDKEHISFVNAFKLGITFLRRSVSTILIYSLIIACLFGIIYSSDIIINTDVYESYNETRIAYDKDFITLVDRRHSIDNSNYNRDISFIEKEDVELLKKNGYKGKIYKSFSLFYTIYEAEIADSFPQGLKIIDEAYFNLYSSKLDLISKNEVYKKEGVYLTDYVIDMFNIHNPSIRLNYDQLDKIRDRYILPHVNGVINTHYKEKYPDIYKCLRSYLLSYRDAHAFDEIDKKRFDDFIYDWQFYAYIYSFEEDFIEYIFNESSSNFIARNVLNYNYQGKEYNPVSNNIMFDDYGVNAISIKTYEALTGKTSPEFSTLILELDTPITINIKLPKCKNNKKAQKSINITFTHIYRDYQFKTANIMLDKHNKELCEKLLPLNGITLENNNDLKEIFKKDLFLNLTISNYYDFYFTSHDRLASIFNKIFKLVILLLLLATMVTLIFYSFYIVKKNIRNIGILKSLGGRSKDILASLSLNIILTAVLASVFSVIFSSLFLFIIEKILLSSYYNASMVVSNSYHLKYLLNNPALMFINIAVISSLLILSSILIFIRLNKYKPNELIKGEK